MQMIHPFPHFTSLELHHKKLLESLTGNFPSYSDFNFISLFTWDTEASIGVSILNRNLVVRFSDYTDSSIFLSFIGTQQLKETVPTLLAYCKQQALPQELRLIPQTVVDALPREMHDQYRVEESRDNHDYILSVKKLVELGPEYQRKRKAINRFRNRQGDTVREAVLDLSDPTAVAAIHKVMEQWKHSRKRSDTEDEKEFVAINRTLEHAVHLGIEGFGIYIDDRLQAFTLFEIAPQKDVAVFHYTKANAEIEGIFEYLKHRLAAHLDSQGVDYINSEQDLGVEGLRIAKESYKPVHYLKKYIIAAKDPA